MKKEWILSQDSFGALLDFLDADRDRAAKEYNIIRLRLIKLFSFRGCPEAEELSDETINRVAAKVSEISKSYHGDPARYFYAVAQKVHLEYLRKSAQMRISSDSETRNDSLMVALEDIEPVSQCLSRCLEQLPADNRDLVLRYYLRETQSTLDHRKKLATELGIAVNALRIRAHRIRLALRQCIDKCLEERML